MTEVGSRWVHGDIMADFLEESIDRRAVHLSLDTHVGGTGKSAHVLAHTLVAVPTTSECDPKYAPKKTHTHSSFYFLFLSLSSSLFPFISTAVKKKKKKKKQQLLALPLSVPGFVLICFC